MGEPGGAEAAAQGWRVRAPSLLIDQYLVGNDRELVPAFKDIHGNTQLLSQVPHLSLSGKSPSLNLSSISF